MLHPAGADGRRPPRRRRPFHLLILLIIMMIIIISIIPGQHRLGLVDIGDGVDVAAPVEADLVVEGRRAPELLQAEIVGPDQGAFAGAGVGVGVGVGIRPFLAEEVVGGDEGILHG